MILIADRDIDKLAEIEKVIADPPSNIKLHRLPETKIDIWQNTRSPNPSCAIIFTHGWGSSRVGLKKFQNAFEVTHCDFITYDLRGHGINPERFSTGGILEKNDLVTIHRYVSENLELKDTDVAWFGVSLGGSLSLQAASLDIDPAFVVADSPFQDWHTAIFERGAVMYGAWVKSFGFGVRSVIYLRTGVDYRKASVLDSASTISSPVMLIHSRDDTDTSSDQSGAIFSKLKPQLSRFNHTNWGAVHAKDVEVEPEKYRELLVSFMTEYVPEFLVEKNNIEETTATNISRNE
jgi:pimeloyl-ACP methyl ester carboxylesterase